MTLPPNGHHGTECPNCHNANQYGDYEGPTCEVCMGDGFISVVDTADELHQILKDALDEGKASEVSDDRSAVPEQSEVR